MQSLPDALVIAGTTLAVATARQAVVQLAKQIKDHKNGRVYWVSTERPPATVAQSVDVVVLGPSETVGTRYFLQIGPGLIGAGSGEL